MAIEQGQTIDEFTKNMGELGLQTITVDGVVKVFDITMQNFQNTSQSVINSIDRFSDTHVEATEIISTINGVIEKGTDIRNSNAQAIDNENRALRDQLSVQQDLAQVIGRAESRGQTITSTGISGGGREEILFSEGFAAKFNEINTGA